MYRPHHARHKGLCKQIGVTAYRVVRHIQRLPQFTRIEYASVIMREHAPKALQRRGRNGRSKSCNIPKAIGLNEVRQPDTRRFMRIGQKRDREAVYCILYIEYTDYKLIMVRNSVNPKKLFEVSGFASETPALSSRFLSGLFGRPGGPSYENPVVFP